MPMDQKIKIKPCTENWENMSPTEQGKHCQKCDKVVHEVQHLDNRTIQKKWKDNGGNLCIRIQEQRTQKILPWYSNWKYAAMASVIAALTNIKESLAQVQDSIQPAKDQTVARTIDQCTVSGTVIDSLSANGPIPFAFLQLELPDSTTYRAYTDLEGKFQFTLDRPLSTADSLRLKCSMMGYETADTLIAIKEEITTEVVLGEKHFCLQETIIAVDRRSIIQGNMVMGIWINDGERRVYKKEVWDQYDTKTYHHDQIERFNLGR